MNRIDLRSDTVTLPSDKMLEAMFKAKVGDMVFGEDEEVNRLEAMAASIFGMEAAAFCPSGTMTNQIAVNIHTRPGDEVICSKLAHIYLHEGGGIAFNSGSSVALIDTPDGTFSADDVVSNINPDDPHKARTSLVCIENTVNRGGGKIWDAADIIKIGQVCRENKLSYHLDGARIFNALAETGENPAQLGKIFDSVSVCLSKGLGAPVGSVLISSEENIRKAKRVRKALGGTMRQAGYIAAAGIYALENNVARIKEDHLHARMISSVLSSCNWVTEQMKTETNIIIFSLADNITSASIAGKLSESGILIAPVDNRRIRIVTHLNITREMTEFVCSRLRNLF
jgi:threonine aldolase